MGELLDRIYGILFQPVAALRDISREGQWGQAVIVLVAVTVLTTWTCYFALWSNIIFALAGIAGALVFWFSGSAILHLVAELYGGKGRAVGLLSANGFIQIPRIFLAPLFILASFLPAPMRMGTLFLAGTGVVLWEISLSVVAIRENYGFSTGRAVLTLVTPYAAVALTLFVSALAMAKVFMHTMSQMGLGGIF